MTSWGRRTAPAGDARTVSAGRSRGAGPGPGPAPRPPPSAPSSVPSSDPGPHPDPQPPGPYRAGDTARCASESSPQAATAPD
ncbi:hypothetical protein CP974_21675 [Streptomyces fradiae ATCC 10745 = DSM 40063]|nr:hypothetical protein CP974_21675 [Streptomyces fradiae ATCC 10745 = DSM 40063]